MTELREAPIVVNLTLEDLNVSVNDERAIEHQLQQQEKMQRMLEKLERRDGGAASRSASPTESSRRQPHNASNTVSAYVSAVRTARGESPVATLNNVPLPPAFTYGNMSFDASSAQQHQRFADKNDFAVSRQTTGGAPVPREWRANTPSSAASSAPFVPSSQRYQAAVSTFQAPARTVHSLQPSDNPLKLRLDQANYDDL